MWSIWIGYLWSCVVLGVSYRMVVGLTLESDVNLYPGFAAITTLAVFILGSSCWGWCYAFGLAFSGLAFVMAADLRWAPIEFGLLWAVVLAMIGLRLHRLGSNEHESENKNTI